MARCSRPWLRIDRGLQVIEVWDVAALLMLKLVLETSLDEPVRGDA